MLDSFQPSMQNNAGYTQNNPPHRFSPIYHISQLIIYKLTPSVNKDIH